MLTQIEKLANNYQALSAFVATSPTNAGLAFNYLQNNSHRTAAVTVLCALIEHSAIFLQPEQLAYSLLNVLTTSKQDITHHSLVQLFHQVNKIKMPFLNQRNFDIFIGQFYDKSYSYILINHTHKVTVSGLDMLIDTLIQHNPTYTKTAAFNASQFWDTHLTFNNVYPSPSRVQNLYVYNLTVNAQHLEETPKRSDVRKFMEEKLPTLRKLLN